MSKRRFPLCCKILLLCGMIAAFCAACAKKVPQAFSSEAEAYEESSFFSDVQTDLIGDQQSSLTEEQPKSESLYSAPAANTLYGGFELPVCGATGYAGVSMELKAQPEESAQTLQTLAPGEAFVILKEQGQWLEVSFKQNRGFLPSLYCMINLPDVVPSLICLNTNAYSSLYRSSGYALKGITGEKLYDALGENERLGRREFAMAVIYPMAKKICAAQQTALSEGYSLVVYETFRPRETQMRVAEALNALLEENEEVYSGIYQGGWTAKWFIAHSLSMHQRGVAMDVSLAQVSACVCRESGGYVYLYPQQWHLCDMPTAMHELSTAALCYEQPYSSRKKEGWQQIPLAPGMTPDAVRLMQYCTGAGLTPLCSEWWHFNDLDAYEAIGQRYSSGDYQIASCISRQPE